MSEQRNAFCDSLQPRLAAYALGEVQDVVDLETHITACASCQADLRSYRQVARVLPYGAPDTAPPPELRDRILAAATDNRGSVSMSGARERSKLYARWVPFGRLPRRAALAFTSVGLALVALLGWNVALRSQLNARSAQVAASRESWQTMTSLLNDPSVRALPLAGEGADGHVWVTERGDVACLVAEGLPNPGVGMVYQVWLREGDHVTSAATFVPHNGRAWTFLRADRPINDFQAIGVTIEPRGGSATPTGVPVLNGALQAAALGASLILQ